MRKRRAQLRRCAAVVLLVALMALVIVIDGRLTEALKIEAVVFEADTQGDAWPDATVTVTFNKPLPEAWLRARLRSRPPAAFDISVEETGRWLRNTRLTINPLGAEVFATDSGYRFELARLHLGFAFATIPTPKVVRAEPNPGLAKTTEPIVLVFDRPMDTRTHLQVAARPEVPLEALWYGDRALVLKHPRLRNATDYGIVLAAGIQDADGHPMQEHFLFGFSTVDPPAVVALAPQGEQVSLYDAVQVAFSTEMDRKAVEAAFQIDPPAEGSFDWPDDKTLVWRPSRLRPAQSYRVQVGGSSRDGDPLPPAEWRFRTLAPPPRVVAGGRSKVVLTFDDDPPSAGRAQALLDLLSNYRVRAILFPTGAWADANPDLIQRARGEGHLVCNHTYGHANLTILSEEAVRFQILNGAGAEQCDLLRPPYGARNGHVEAIAASLGYRIYMWTVDSRDWEGLSALEISNLVLGAVRPGAIVLFHMHAPHTLEALPGIIERLQGAGYVLSY